MPNSAYCKAPLTSGSDCVKSHHLFQAARSFPNNSAQLCIICCSEINTFLESHRPPKDLPLENTDFWGFSTLQQIKLNGWHTIAGLERQCVAPRCISVRNAAGSKCLGIGVHYRPLNLNRLSNTMQHTSTHRNSLLLSAPLKMMGDALNPPLLFSIWPPLVNTLCAYQFIPATWILGSPPPGAL